MIRGYITKEYKDLQHNSIFVLAILMMAIIGIDVVQVIIAPSWIIRLFCVFGTAMSVLAAWLLYTFVSSFVEHRDYKIILVWIVSYSCLLMGLLPISIFVYLNCDWYLLSTYGKIATEIYRSLENIVLPVSLVMLISIIYWIVTIQLYKKSYLTYFSLTQKKKIYG